METKVSPRKAAITSLMPGEGRGRTTVVESSYFFRHTATTHGNALPRSKRRSCSFRDG
jgi:hypothetical protein